MSQFNELSQAIGTAVHKATKQSDGTYTAQITREVLADNDVFYAVKDLVEHTIKNTEDNE